MWLKRLISNNYGNSESGGAGSDLGVASTNVLGLTGDSVLSDETPTRQEQINIYKQRKRKRKQQKQRKNVY